MRVITVKGSLERKNNMTSTANGEIVVETRNLTKRYGEFTALDDLSIHVKRGQILGFIGPNGAGKTTAIKILVGLAKPSAGSASIAGADCVRDARRIKRLVGYMPDRFGSYDNMRVREYLDFFGAAFGIGRRRRKQRIEEVLELTDSTYMQDRYVETLSHGMQKKVGIARTLLHDPEVLIFDEPANGLDPLVRVELRGLLMRLAELGKSLIVTSHILPELSRICDQVAIVTQGRLRAFGSLERIMRDVNQRRMLEVQFVSPEQAEGAESIIRQQIGDSAQDLTLSKAESLLRFATEQTDEQLADLLAGLVQEGCRIVQYRELQTDLEDAFLSVAKRDQTPAGSGGPV